MNSIAWGLMAFGFVLLVVGLVRMINPKNYAFAFCFVALCTIGMLLGFGYGDSE